MDLRSFIDEALHPPRQPYARPRRLGRITLARSIKDCHHWQEVEDIQVIEPELVTPWSPALALERMEVVQVPFEELAPSWDAYARGRELALRDDLAHPLLALTHELVHVAARHTTGNHERPSRPVREVQAEVGAFVLLALMGAIEGDVLCTSRHYIAGWLNKSEEALTDEHLLQTELAIETVWQAGT